MRIFGDAVWEGSLDTCVTATFHMWDVSEVDSIVYMLSFHIVLFRKQRPPSVISTLSDFHDHASRFNDDCGGGEKGLDSKEYDLSLTSVLADQCEKPVISLGPFRQWVQFCQMTKLYFSNLYIYSYTPKLFALIESRKTWLID